MDDDMKRPSKTGKRARAYESKQNIGRARERKNRQPFIPGLTDLLGVELNQYGRNVPIKVEEDTAEVINATARLLAKRYAEKNRGNFVGANDIEDKETGIRAQIMFLSVLNQFKIPYLYQEPTLDLFVHKIPWDFYIPGLGRVEIKGFKHYCKKFQYKKGLLDSEKVRGKLPDYVIAVKLETVSTASIKGFLTGKEVSELEVSKAPNLYTPFDDAYQCDLEKLHPFSDLWPGLAKCAIEMKSAEG